MTRELRERSGRAVAWGIAFISGFAAMVVELGGIRLLAPTYGISTVPWTAGISVVLAGLALGSWLGGRWADRGRPSIELVLVGAAAVFLLPLTTGPVPDLALRAFGLIGGVLFSAALFLGPPAILLGALVPMLVRRSTRTLAEVGSRSGEVAGAATFGSIVGTAATGFVLFPLLPVPALFACGTIVLLALLPLTRRLPPSMIREEAGGNADRRTTPAVG